MFCPYCGKHVADDSEFCKNCGKKVSQEAEVVVASENTPTEKTLESKSEQTQETKIETKYTVSIVIGVILLIVGLYLTIIHKSIAVAIVGQEQILKEAFFGGSSFQQTVTMILVGSIVVLVGGIILLFNGLIPVLKKK